MKTLLKTLSVLVLGTTVGGLSSILNTTLQKDNIATDSIKNKITLEKKYNAINLSDIIVNNNLGLINNGKDQIASKNLFRIFLIKLK